MKIIKLGLVLLTLLILVTLPTSSQILAESYWEFEYLGNPSKSQYSDSTPEEINARNVWDLQYFAGNIYIGAGDYGDNMGSVVLNAFDCSENRFITIGEITEEQLSNFIIIDDKLILPGIDAIASESHEFANWYTISSTNEITKYRNIPEAAHCFDIVKYHDKLFTAIGGTTSLVAMSSDNGETFELLPTTLAPRIKRMYDFVILDDVLYATNTEGSIPRFFYYDESSNCFVRKNNIPELYEICECADLYDISAGLIKRKTSFNNAWIFVSEKAFVTYDLNSFEEINISEQKISDCLVRNDTLYLLAGTQNSEGNWDISVYSTTNLTTWNKELSFSAGTYARSFELSDEGDWYFGLGSSIKTPHIQNGEIIRAKKITKVS